jgi:TonB family protein
MPQRSMRPNPVALEVPVSVAGARPVSSKDNRELFTEETTTVLVFKDGAVIQLSAAVAVGQLLFLTDKRSKKEVVCQVVHKRSHRPTSCFVELEFTEPEENFWGVSFPAQADSAQIPPVAEAVEAQETTEDDGSEPLAAPKSEDVAQLKDEVAALKAQLEELRGKQTSEDKEAVAKRLAEAEAAARAAAEVEARQKAEEEARKKAEREGKPATIGMRLPSAGMGAAMPEQFSQTANANAEAALEHGEEIDPLEDLLPKPALDFSHAPKYADPNDPYNIYRPERKGGGKRELVAGGVVLAVVIAVSVGAWYKNLLPFLHRAPKATGAANSGDAAPSKSADAKPAGNLAGAPVSNFSPSVSSVTPEPARAAAANAAPNPPASAPPVIAPIVPAPIESPAERAALAEKGAMRVVAPAKSGARKAGKNHGRAQTSGESAPVPVAPEISVSDQPTVPAKLLRAVQPIYPPDAMRNYITGDVRIEAEVDKQGRIGAMKILLGPKQFRQVAMEALRQYEYEPARQGGKPVASKVTVTIKFWFDP